MGYDPAQKIYHIVYKDEDTKEYHHNEVCDWKKGFLPMSKRQKKPKLVKVCYICSKYNPKETDYKDHIITSHYDIVYRNYIMNCCILFQLQYI